MALNNKSLKKNNQNATVTRDNSKLESQNTEKLTAAQKAAQKKTKSSDKNKSGAVNVATAGASASSLDPREEALDAVENTNPTGANTSSEITNPQKEEKGFIGFLKKHKKLAIALVAAIASTLIAVSVVAGLANNENDKLDGQLGAANNQIEQVEGENESLKGQNEATLQNNISQMNSIVASAEEAYNAAIGAYNGMWTDGTEIPADIAEKHTTLRTAYTELASLQSIYTGLKAAYDAGNSATTISDLIDAINAVVDQANAVSTAATDLVAACNNYNVYQITFTEAQVEQYKTVLKDIYKGGKVLGVESCTYNKEDGKVTIVTNCVDKKGESYTGLITGTIEKNISASTATVGYIMGSLSKSSDVTYSYYQGELASQLNGMGSATINQGDKTVEGKTEIQYSVKAIYNAKTDRTSVYGEAIVKVYDNENNLAGFKAYRTDTSSRKGNVSASDVEEEMKSKLLNMLNSDSEVTYQGVNVNFEYLPEDIEL